MVIICLLPLLAGCTDDPPDTSAPERVEIDRASDWTGALLYIADGEGPVPSLGSIRIYDNVSGFVETTVEQTFAANPSDLFVSENRSRMYVSSMANGIVDLFFWDGNGWRRGTSKIDTPATRLFAMENGPDQLLYLAGSTMTGEAGALYRLDTNTDDVIPEPVVIPSITEARGVTWSADASLAFVTGPGADGPTLQTLSWPAAEATGSVSLPVNKVNQVQLSPDGLVLYVACEGTILTADPVDGKLISSLSPSADPSTEYYDVAFSADGRYLFTPGTVPDGDATLFIIDLATGSVISQVTHVGARANGIKRIE
ncbi:MAG: hypothetical protein C4534_09275 [Gaiellales bacterium]|nr:MAG: hypothetical protein C4534_09275 [Gaiellales bacterium]